MEKFYEFLRTYPVGRFGKGEVILQQDEIPRLGYTVKSGIIKTYNITVSGEEKPIGFELKYDTFPINWVFSKTDRAQYYYESLTDCELYLVPISNYVNFLKTKPGSMFALFQNLIDRNTEYQMRINALEQSKAKDKVLHTLHFLVQRFGRKLSGYMVEIQLPFTQQDMANFMGLARETAAIELKKLERLGVISYRHRSYIIETFKLKELLGEDYDVTFEFETFYRPNRAVKLIDKLKNAYGKTYK